MSVPTKLFIDTSILDGCAYNFESAAVQPIVGVAKDKGISLLLPDTTEREMLTHIKKQSDEVLTALVNAQKKAPFLRKWQEWPLNNSYKPLLSLTLKELSNNEFREFLSTFTVVKLGIDNIKLSEVLHWYENGIKVFAKPNKKSEFPDAFALSSILTYARNTGDQVAVVSMDDDFWRACALHDCLFFHKSIGTYVECLLLSDEHVMQVRAILDESSNWVSDAIEREFVNLRFSARYYESVDILNPEVEDISFTELNVIGVGNREVSVSLWPKFRSALMPCTRKRIITLNRVQKKRSGDLSFSRSKFATTRLFPVWRNSQLTTTGLSSYHLIPSRLTTTLSQCEWTAKFEKETGLACAHMES